MNTLNTTPLPSTLSALAQQKAELKKEIDQQKAKLTQLSKEMTAPFTPSSNKSGSSMMRAFNMGIAVFDGVTIGVKVIRRIKNFKRMFR